MVKLINCRTYFYHTLGILISILGHRFVERGQRSQKGYYGAEDHLLVIYIAYLQYFIFMSRESRFRLYRAVTPHFAVNLDNDVLFSFRCI